MVLLIYNSITAIIEQVCRVDISREWKYLTCQFQYISHDKRIGITGDWNQVVGLKQIALFQYFLPYSCHGDPVRFRIKIFEPACYLCGLKGNTTHASLLQRIVDNCTDLVVIQSLL